MQIVTVSTLRRGWRKMICVGYLAPSKYSKYSRYVSFLERGLVGDGFWELR